MCVVVVVKMHPVKERILEIDERWLAALRFVCCASCARASRSRTTLQHIQNLKKNTLFLLYCRMSSYNECVIYMASSSSNVNVNYELEFVNRNTTAKRNGKPIIKRSIKMHAKKNICKITVSNTKIREKKQHKKGLCQAWNSESTRRVVIESRQ